jgi:hypothetical protein
MSTEEQQPEMELHINIVVPAHAAPEFRRCAEILMRAYNKKHPEIPASHWQQVLGPLLTSVMGKLAADLERDL